MINELGSEISGLKMILEEEKQKALDKYLPKEKFSKKKSIRRSTYKKLKTIIARRS